MLRKRLAVVGLAGALLVVGSHARADGASEAETLFAQGRELLEKGSFAEACPKLARSEQLAPAVGTLLNLAYCYEQLGRMRSAMDSYGEAEVLAKSSGDAKKATFARDRFVAVEKSAIKVVVRVVPPEAPGMEVVRNGQPVPKSDWGQMIPIDPDEIVVSASAPKHESWKTVVMARGPGAIVTVFVPPLGDGTATAASSSGKGAALGTRRIGALGAGAGAAISLGAGMALALGAKSRYDDTRARCDATGCDEGALTVQRNAVAQGNVATALIALGLVLAGAGAYLWLSAGDGSAGSVGARF
jgi:tetratricopeptide (TPR) repeat protein